MKHVALYARVSTAQQEKQGTIASQLAALVAYADEHGLAIAPEHQYLDDGYSGARLDRPGLERLRDAVWRGGGGSGVVPPPPPPPPPHAPQHRRPRKPGGAPGGGGLLIRPLHHKRPEGGVGGGG